MVDYRLPLPKHECYIGFGNLLSLCIPTFIKINEVIFIPIIPASMHISYFQDILSG